MKIVIEHLEEDLHDWCCLEYNHMDIRTGPNRVVVTNLPSQLIRGRLNTGIETHEKKFVEAFPDVEPAKVCLLDPCATEELSPEDAGKFDYYLFGGILGQHPPIDRTAILRGPYPSRNLGPRQMSTDTAVIVTDQVVSHGRKLSDIAISDDIEVQLGPQESVELPYRYMLDSDGKPIIPPGLKKILKQDVTLDDFF